MPKRPTVPVRILIEQLEDRLALSTSTVSHVPLSSVNSPPGSVSSVSASLHRGTLSIVGTSAEDVIQLQARTGRISVAGKTFKAIKIKRVVSAAEEGSDVITIDSHYRRDCRIFAGAGDDVVQSGQGDDTIYGDGGKDSLYGGGGNDLIYGGTSDNTLDGGPGANTIVNKSPFQTQSPSDMSAEILNQINSERSKQGLKPLAFDSQLVQAAGLHARNMAALSDTTSLDNALRHTLPGVNQPTLSSRLDSVGFSARTGTENIAYGYDTATEVVTAWLNSPSHRANILSSTVSLAGIAVEANGDGVLFFCQVFATKK
jgi:uncharacterized protein YkwD